LQVVEEEEEQKSVCYVEKEKENKSSPGLSYTSLTTTPTAKKEEN